MLIFLIVLIAVVSDACGSCIDDPPPTIPTPVPPPCRTVTCAAACDAPSYTTCGSCSFGDIDLSTCPPMRDGGPWDGSMSCDDVPCSGPSACVTSCDDPEPFYIGCCPCPEGSIDARLECPEPTDGGVLDGEVPDAGPPPDGATGDLLPLGSACADDRQCESGLCYGTVLTSGAFDSPTCQAACLPVADYGHYCLSDRHCCGRPCCLGCGEQEGLCLEGT